MDASVWVKKVVGAGRGWGSDRARGIIKHDTRLTIRIGNAFAPGAASASRAEAVDRLALVVLVRESGRAPERVAVDHDWVLEVVYRAGW